MAHNPRLICRVDAVQWWDRRRARGSAFFSLLPAAQTRCTLDSSNEQRGAGPITMMIIIILKHPLSPAPTPPTKQGSLTLRDLEIAQSWEAEEWKSQAAILISHFCYQWEPAEWASMGMTWILIDLYAALMLPLCHLMARQTQSIKIVALMCWAEREGIRVGFFGRGKTPHFGVKIEVHPEK